MRTRVGYAGGTAENPTYRNLGDHTETIQIDYDPTQISYHELLDLFWDSHDPTRPAWSRQYMSIIFFHNDEQKKLAIETKERQEVKTGRKVSTEIVPIPAFYLAEAYHQKYSLRNNGGFMAEFRAIYPDDAGFVASTAAARVNGYLGGNGTLEALRSELASLGLSPEASQELWEIMAARTGSHEQCPLPNPEGQASSG